MEKYEKFSSNFADLFDFMKFKQYCIQLLLMIRHVIQVVKFQTNVPLTVSLTPSFVKATVFYDITACP